MKNFEKLITGTWRTHKVFCFTGKVLYQSDLSFQEMTIDANRVLTMLDVNNGKNSLLLQTAQWRFEAVKQRPFLYFGNKQAFEIITLETDDLVLADQVKGEKLFFARMPGWHQRISPEINAVRHIKPGMATVKK